MKINIIEGNLLDQNVDTIINPWNRNIIPWWLLIKQGVSGAIKKKAGSSPFKELAKFGSIPLGEARITTSGNLNFKAIIHVAGINIFWIATENSVKNSVINAIELAEKEGFKSIAIPLIGSGSGNRGQEWSLNLIKETLEKLECELNITIVKFKKSH